MGASLPASRAAACATAVAVLALTGCHCDKDRPYTPFRIEPSAAAIPPSGAPSAEAAPAASFAVRDSVLAPLNTSDFTLDGVVFGVDKSRVIERALAGDFDGDGKPDGVAWTRARGEPPESESSGELVFFSSRAPAGRVVAKLPGFVPAGPGCRHGLSLAQTGARTVTLDVAAHCDAQLVPRSPTRALSVVAPAGDPPTKLVLRLADPAPSEIMTFTVDSMDRDGDGKDDVTLGITLETSDAKPEARARLVWIDRAAGLSRDVSEPSQSLLFLISKDTARQDGKDAPRLTPIRVANARRLASAVCAESGASRVFDADGQAIACGSLGPVMADLLSAEVRAAVQRRDPVSAIGALGRDGWFGPALSDKSRAALEKDILSVAPARAATEVVLPAAPKAKAGLPRWSPLAFESASSLLVQTADMTKRVTLPELAVTDAVDVEAWPVTVGGDKDARWMGIAFPCDRSEILLMLSGPDGAPLPPAPTALVAPRPGPCGRGPVPAPALVPLEWSPARRAGLVGGALFGADSVTKLAPMVPRGSPRSADAKTLVLPWARGLLVVSGNRAETWTVQSPDALSDCVVANDAARVACVRETAAVAVTKDVTTPPQKK